MRDKLVSEPKFLISHSSSELVCDKLLSELEVVALEPLGVLVSSFRKILLVSVETLD